MGRFQFYDADTHPHVYTRMVACGQACLNFPRTDRGAIRLSSWNVQIVFVKIILNQNDHFHVV